MSRPREGQEALVLRLWGHLIEQDKKLDKLTLWIKEIKHRNLELRCTLHRKGLVPRSHVDT